MPQAHRGPCGATDLRPAGQTTTTKQSSSHKKSPTPTRGSKPCQEDHGKIYKTIKTKKLNNRKTSTPAKIRTKPQQNKSKHSHACCASAAGRWETGAEGRLRALIAVRDVPTETNNHAENCCRASTCAIEPLQQSRCRVSECHACMTTADNSTRNGNQNKKEHVECARKSKASQISPARVTPPA